MTSPRGLTALACFVACAGLIVIAPPVASAREPAPAQTASSSSSASCSEAYESGQRLRKKGALRAASHELVVCAREGCPSALASDCLRWLGEVEAALPSIVVAVVDARGHDVVDARVGFDGAPSVDPADGRAVDVDPGRHHIRVVAPNRPPVEEDVVVREGEKRRTVRITVATLAPPLAAQEEAPPASASGNSHTLAYVLLGVGAASLATAGGLGVYGLSQRSDLDRCRPGCGLDGVESANRTFLFTDILLAVGLVAAGAGTFFYFSSPSSEPARAAGRR